MISDNRRKDIKTDFACLFSEPLISVVVLCRTYGKVKPVRVGAPVLRAFQHYGLHALVAVRCDAASVKCSTSVDDRNLVTASVSEHSYAVA